MKYPVLKKFRDKNTKKIHQKGTDYITDSVDRAAELQALGFIGAAAEATQTEGSGDVWPKSAGGGYWDLPNGERVRGKENAIEAIEALNAAVDGEGGEVNGGEADESEKV